jgi:putative endonuclease
MRGGWVYIMTDRYRGALYIGLTSDIAARVWAHREGRDSTFCKRYGLTRLVHVEQAPTIEESHRAGKSHEEMAARVEDRADRDRQP